MRDTIYIIGYLIWLAYVTVGVPYNSQGVLEFLLAGFVWVILIAIPSITYEKLQSMVKNRKRG